MFDTMSLKSDAALVASVPIQALGKNRVRQSAKRLMALATPDRSFDKGARPAASDYKQFRRLCRMLLSAGTLDQREAAQLQDYAIRIHDELDRASMPI